MTSMIHPTDKPSGEPKFRRSFRAALSGFLKFFGRLLSVSVALMLTVPAMAAQERLDIGITYISRDEKPHVPLSLLDLPIEDNGVRGVELGLRDSQTTGSFLNQHFELEKVLVEVGADIAETVNSLATQGSQLFIADLAREDLLTVADLLPDALILNIRAKDDSLRRDECRKNILHIPPSRSMAADGLSQYLNWKRWNKLILVTGRHEQDKAFAASFRRSAKRFGLKIVQEKDWTSKPGARNTDSGHHSLQQEIPAFTQFKDHDVLVVADEGDEFGEYMMFRTSRPRPVAGTQGLMGISWHRSQEQWGATQIQRRFEKLAGRPMSERDYGGWAAMRTLGEAVTNTASNNPETLREFVLSSKFKLAGFKGVPLTFRTWNGQLRQPILIVGPRALVSVSPQAGFLHERSELDTMGFDESESGCSVF